MPVISTDKVRLELISLLTGATEATLQLASISSAVLRCVYSDGLGPHTIFQNPVAVPAAVEIMDHCTPSGNTFVIRRRQNPTTVFIDACFDGVYYWFLSATTVFQREGPETTSIVVKSWAHGLANVRGILTDGNHIIIMTT